MKRLLCALLCALMIICLLCSCGKDENQSDEPQNEVQSEHSWLDDKFAEAELLYSWFTGCDRPATDSSDTKEKDGASYARVIESGLTDRETLRARIRAVFTEEITSELMENEVYSGTPVFRDFDGKLYFCTESLGLVPSNIGERNGEIISRSDIELIYRMDVKYDYYASSFAATYDYVLTLGEDSKWYFSSFKLPAMLIAEQMFLSDE